MLAIYKFVVATAVFSSLAFGQTTSLPPQPSTVLPTCTSGSPGTLTVQGVGESEATADEAQVSLSISILNDTADGARQVAASFANNVITSVQNIPGIFPDNVTTASVSVSPKTTYSSSTGISTIVGYTYTNRLSVAIGNLTGDLLAKVLDTAVQNGGNNLTISSVSFSLSPGLSYNKTVEARSQAARDARTTAQQYAQGFGVNLGAVLTVADQSIGVTPVQSDTTDRSVSFSSPSVSSASASTPVSIGKQTVNTKLLVSYTICTPLT